jgi:hypothetical protein
VAVRHHELVDDHLAAVEAALASLTEPRLPADLDCLLWVAAVTAALTDAGVPARTCQLWLTGPGPGPFAHLHLLNRVHQVTVTAAGAVVDLTARQYPDLRHVPARWITPRRRYLEDVAAATGMTADLRTPQAGAPPAVT